MDLTGSYLAVFLIGAAIALAAGGGFLALVREPRTGRLYAVTPGPDAVTAPAAPAAPVEL